MVKKKTRVSLSPRPDYKINKEQPTCNDCSQQHYNAAQPPQILPLTGHSPARATHVMWTDPRQLGEAPSWHVARRPAPAWELMDNMGTNLVIKALQKAIDRRNIPKGLIVHSDGGGQYAAHRFKQLLAAHDFESSMTRKDNHYDNAMAESLFSRFKAELLEKGAFANFEEAYTEIFEYIEIYYNRKRRHSGIDYQIPDQYELLWT